VSKHATTKTIVLSPAAQQVFRRIKRNKQLHGDLKAIAQASPRHDYIGPNAAVMAMAERLGFKTFDLAIAEVRCAKVMTFIVVPFGVWNDKMLREKVFELRRMARREGHQSMLVPQGVLQREPRLSNSRLVSRSARLRLDATGMMSVLTYLIENGASSVSELASLITSVDPIGAIFGMLASGDIEIDMGKPISPSTMVDLGHRHSGH